jgi:hypothetical protein
LIDRGGFDRIDANLQKRNYSTLCLCSGSVFVELEFCLCQQAMEILFNEAMLIERSQHLGAGHYQRSRDRIDYESNAIY